ncbi:rhomboid family intramembrane serine protease [Limimaricola pyoseonensis]|uniref:rhomboid family intramembrane serine protease n=1 Tax=Limimaricola pyoseonensis TaxID=521013 RepID=UPI000D7BFB8E|nr:rhomboid family intramembrane serine protease [Limimaricola pyoseonensis]
MSAAAPAPRGGRAAVLWLLALALVLPELALSLADLGGAAIWRARAYQNGAFWVGLLHDWRPNYAVQPALMFLSYSIWHAGPLHLLGNLSGLAWLGPPLLARLAARGLLAVWLAGVLGGGAGFALLSRAPEPMVGASGAVFGLAGAWVALGARARAGRRLWRWIGGWLLLLVAVNLLGWVMADGQLAWQTHLGGALAGAAAAALMPTKRGTT